MPKEGETLADVLASIAATDHEIAVMDVEYTLRCLARLNYKAESYMKLLHPNKELQSPFLSVMAYVQEARRRLLAREYPERAVIAANAEAKGATDG